jgi:heat shock protein HslJ
LDNAPFSGAGQECHSESGRVTYRVEASNSAGQTVFKEETITVGEAAPDNPLVGTRWQAMAFYDAEVGGIGVPLPGTSLTAAFGADGKLNGSAGCNTYSASYLVDGSLLSITPPTSTSAICGEPEGIMEQEAAFLSALASAGGFNLQGSQLQILNASGQLLLELVPLTR